MNPDWFVKGQGVYGVDAAQMKHRRYNGIKILLVGRHGNFSNQVAAVAIAAAEDFDNFAWFLHVLYLMDIHYAKSYFQWS